jgi:hypothetical protein
VLTVCRILCATTVARHGGRSGGGNIRCTCLADGHCAMVFARIDVAMQPRCQCADYTL